MSPGLLHSSRPSARKPTPCKASRLRKNVFFLVLKGYNTKAKAAQKGVITNIKRTLDLRTSPKLQGACWQNNRTPAAKAAAVWSPHAENLPILALQNHHSESLEDPGLADCQDNKWEFPKIRGT